MTSDTSAAKVITPCKKTPEADVAELQRRKPRLLIEKCSPDRTVAALRDILKGSPDLYDRGLPVRLVRDQIQGGVVAQVMKPHGLVLMAHTLCRPYIVHKGEEKDAGLPHSHAVMYLEWRGEWRLRPLNGIASAPLLQDDGRITSAVGYDPASSMWCEDVPDLTDLIPAQPTKSDAISALRCLRNTFKTFCFGDADTILDSTSGVAVVDTNKPPGRDESSFLVALLTAVCRPSLHLAPGILLRAAQVSGAGAGKGLLARCICNIAFGREPHAVTAGATAEELEKRIAAELIEGSPSLFLDNLNNTAFKSDLLASAITERPARVRLLGQSHMVPLNASTLVIMTGNGLTLSEDLARRFIAVGFDPRTEDPEARPFTNDIRAEVSKRAAALTIWRWGRTSTDIKRGLPLGSFDQWCRWVRDPLLALGCQDPVERVSEIKERDGHRQAVSELFATWWDKHGDRPVAVSQLDYSVKLAADPQGRGRQYLASKLEKLTGTRMAGFVVTRQASAGKWGVATYALKKTNGDAKHRDHRGHGGERTGQPDGSYAPYAPNADRGANGHDKQTDNPPTTTTPSMSSVDDGWSTEDWQTFFEERASFAECDGGLPRTEAKLQALECCITEWFNRNPAPSPAGQCAWCRQAETKDAVLLPYGAEAGTHTWLHAGCWGLWQKARRIQATEALAWLKE
jgi:hypothetical protein